LTKLSSTLGLRLTISPLVSRTPADLHGLVRGVGLWQSGLAGPKSAQETWR